MTPSVDLVVARFNESVDWAWDFSCRIFVYNKGSDVGRPKNVYLVPLKNVGREAHSYLFHITQNYDSLADWTVFTQGSWTEHFPPDFDFRRLLTPHPTADVSGGILLPTIREWDEDGWLRWHGKWLEELASGRLKRSKCTLPEFFAKFLELDIEKWGHIAYFPGAIFGVRRSAIHRRSLAFYRCLLHLVSGHIQPEEAHYLERAWLYIFGAPQLQVSAALVGGKPMPNGQFALEEPV